MVRGADWHTTHCGPLLPRPSAPSFQDEGSVASDTVAVGGLAAEEDEYEGCCRR